MAYLHRIRHGGNSVRNSGYYTRSNTETRYGTRSSNVVLKGTRAPEIVLVPGTGVAAGGTLASTLDLSRRGWAEAQIAITCVFASHPTQGVVSVVEAGSTGGAFSDVGEPRLTVLYDQFDTTFTVGFITEFAQTQIEVVNGTNAAIIDCRITAVGIRA